MSAVLAAVADPRVTIGADHIVRIIDLRIDDAEVHAVVSASSAPDATVTRMLTVGARALSVAQLSVDMNAFETSFAQLTQTLSQQLDQAHGRVVGAATDLLTDPDRGLTARLQAWRRDVDKSLDSTFNPDLANERFRPARQGPRAGIGRAAARDPAGCSAPKSTTAPQPDCWPQCASKSIRSLMR